MSELPAEVRQGGQAGPAAVPPLRYELGRFSRAISLGLLLQPLIFSLRIADGFGQHLVQLSFGLLRFALGWLPLCHELYVGMREVELNPYHSSIIQNEY